MSALKPTEAEYYATLEDNLETGAYDFVANQREYALFRRALMAWVAEQDATWDAIAREQELGIEP